MYLQVTLYTPFSSVSSQMKVSSAHAPSILGDRMSWLVPVRYQGLAPSHSTCKLRVPFQQTIKNLWYYIGTTFIFLLYFIATLRMSQLLVLLFLSHHFPLSLLTQLPVYILGWRLRCVSISDKCCTNIASLNPHTKKKKPIADNYDHFLLPKGQLEWKAIKFLVHTTSKR